MSWSCDGEPGPDFYAWSEPVARKPHHCCECSAQINVGEKHFACRGKWDFGFSSERQHLTCMEACMLIRDDLEGECICFGGLKEWFDEGREWGMHEKNPAAWRRLCRLMAKIRVRERRHREAKAAGAGEESVTT